MGTYIYMDFTYGGFGSNWNGMLAVLLAKFKANTPWAYWLLKSGDSYLVEHNLVEGRDQIWSDNANGEGTNWLGLQIMLVRDKLSGQRKWTDFIESVLDTANNGMPFNDEKRE